MSRSLSISRLCSLSPAGLVGGSCPPPSGNASVSTPAKDVNRTSGLLKYCEFNHFGVKVR